MEYTHDLYFIAQWKIHVRHTVVFWSITLDKKTTWRQSPRRQSVLGPMIYLAER